MIDLELRTLERAPFGYIYLNEDLNVEYVNQYARTLVRCELGSAILEYLHPDARKEFSALIANRNPQRQYELQLLLDIGTKTIQASCASNQAGGIDFFIQDISESKVLGRQLQETSEPARKFVHDISNALASTIGYSELLSMMLSEQEMFAGEKLSVIRRYQSEVSEGLMKAQSLIHKERARKNRTSASTGSHSESTQSSHPLTTTKPPKQPTSLVRQHIVIVDDERSIAEFLAELMRSRHYKATIFTSSIEAHEYLIKNSNKVDLVILDQLMPQMTGIDLATDLLSMDINLPIVLCSGDQALIESQSNGGLNIKNFISKPVDISELIELVATVLS
ncbi:MAG: CheY-like chemotaxis protein [Candidatus Azotimanducaceae bacterium]